MQLESNIIFFLIYFKIIIINLKFKIYYFFFVFVGCNFEKIKNKKIDNNYLVIQCIINSYYHIIHINY